MANPYIITIKQPVTVEQRYRVGEILGHPKKIATQKEIEEFMVSLFLNALAEAEPDTHEPAVEQPSEPNYGLGNCPVCESKLRYCWSAKNQQSFIGCSNYPNCNYALPLSAVCAAVNQEASV